MPGCERSSETGLDPLWLRFKYILACLSNGREGPGGLNRMGDFNISWKEDICTPLGDGGGVFIPLPGP